MNELDAILISTLCAMHDPIAALSGSPITPDDAILADRILNIFGQTGFTDSTIDDLLELAYDNAPITFSANRSCNYAATNSTLMTIHHLDHAHTATIDYSLN